MYKIPLSPIDLTKIYKQKQGDIEFSLSVNYKESKEKLSTKQILIYLSNTAFRCSFDEVDEDLIKEYITLDFLVDSPSLARVVSNIIKMKLGGDIGDSLGVYSLADMESFIANNEELVEDLISAMSSLPLFIMEKINELEDGSISFDHGVDAHLREGESKVGLNILDIVTSGFDAVLLVLSERGVSSYIDSEIFNDKSQYYGSDLMKSLFSRGVVSQLLKIIPEEIVRTKSVSKA